MWSSWIQLYRLPFPFLLPIYDPQAVALFIDQLLGNLIDLAKSEMIYLP